MKCPKDSEEMELDTKTFRYCPFRGQKLTFAEAHFLMCGERLKLGEREAAPFSSVIVILFGSLVEGGKKLGAKK